VERYWDILVQSPKRGTTFDRVYHYYVDTGHAEVLLADCKKFTEENPKDAKAWMLLGLVAERRGNGTQAVEAFQLATKFDVKDSVAPFYLGEILITQGRLRDAIAALEQSVERKPGRMEIRTILQTLGRTYERFGESRKATEIWNRLENLFPDDPDTLVQIAELLESENRLEEALKRYEKLIAQTTDEFSRVRFSLAAAEIKLRQGQEQETLRDLDRLLDQLTSDSWIAESVRKRIDRLFVRNNDESGLTDFYRKRLKRYPNEIESVQRLALTLRRLDHIDETHKLLSETITKLPSNIPLRLTFIDFLIDQKEIPAALEQFQTIDRLSPNNADYLVRWGQIVLQNKELSESVRKREAVRIWTKIADAAPNDAAAAITVADILLRNNFSDDAEHFYRQAVKLRPNDVSYREYLAIFYHSQHQNEKVLETLQPMTEGDKKTVTNLTQTGNLLLSLNYVTESFDRFKDAAELAPNDLQTPFLHCPQKWRK
jgi:tetratricopeptide (TPR) repeat protein